MATSLLGTGMETLGFEHIAKTDVLNGLSTNQSCRNRPAHDFKTTNTQFF